MAHASGYGQPGQPTQQQALQARLDDPLVSEDFRGEIRDINDYTALSAAFAARRKQDHEIASLSQDSNKNFPNNDPAKQRQLVGRLFEAMRNQIDILDGTVKKDKDKQVVRDVNGEPVMRMNATIRRTRDEPNIRLELLAWGLLIGIRDAQLGALYALMWTWDRNFQYQYFDSFIDRYNAVLESINVSKKAVADLMEPSWLCRLANAPDHEVQRKSRNARGNRNKQALLEEAGSKRKRDRQENEGQEGDDEDSHEAASQNAPVTPGTPAVAAASAPRQTPKTASRNTRKQPKRSASDTARRAAANTPPATAPPSEQPSMLAAPEGFTQQAAVAPQTAVNNFHPTMEAGGLGPEINYGDQFFGPTNGWTPSVGGTAYPSTQPDNTSVSLQAQPWGFALGQRGHPQQPFSQNISDQAFNLNSPWLGNPVSPAYGNNIHFLPQANDFGAQFVPQTVMSPGIEQGLNATPGYVSTAPSTPFSSAPQTPWSSDTPEFNPPHDLSLALDYQQFANAWDAHLSFWEDKHPQVDFSCDESFPSWRA